MLSSETCFPGISGRSELIRYPWASRAARTCGDHWDLGKTNNKTQPRRGSAFNLCVSSLTHPAPFTSGALIHNCLQSTHIVYNKCGAGLEHCFDDSSSRKWLYAKPNSTPVMIMYVPYIYVLPTYRQEASRSILKIIDRAAPDVRVTRQPVIFYRDVRSPID